MIGAGLGGVFNVNDEVGDISKSQQCQGLKKKHKSRLDSDFSPETLDGRGKKGIGQDLIPIISNGQEFRRHLMGIKPPPIPLTHKEFSQINRKGKLFLLHALLVFMSSLCHGPLSPATPEPSTPCPSGHWNLELPTLHLPQRPLT